MTTRTDSPTLTTDEAVARLRDTVGDRLITADDPRYDDARGIVLGGFDPRPAAIVRVRDTHDVVATIAVARASGLDLAVRSGGHSGAGHSTADGGLVIDVRDLTAIEVDGAAATAWIGAGATAGEVSTELATRGRAIGFGDTGSVGISGITLGGGVGYLVRKHGLAIDNLLAVELVTADGRVLTVDADHEPDLFWALRGGGGNFGVVTKLRYRLAELAGITGGMLVLPATPDTVAAFIAAAEAAPDEVSTIANVMPAPPMPFLPAEVHGQLVILGMLAFAGDDASAGERAMAPFRAIATPLADMVGPKGYPEMFPPDDPSYKPTAVARTMYLDHVDREVAATILDRLASSDAPMRVAQLRVLGGAHARVPADATAYAHRASRIMANLAAFYVGPDDRPAKERWVDGFVAAIHQGDDGAYVNFVGDEGEARIRAAYPGATWDRLREVKRRYDPENLFHRNQNIPPSDAPAA